VFLSSGPRRSLARIKSSNGLLLTPSIYHLFDRGFISFEDSGTLVISPVAHRLSLQRMGIDITKVVNVGGFTSGQKQFLDFHRNSVLLQSIRASARPSMFSKLPEADQQAILRQANKDEFERYISAPTYGWPGIERDGHLTPSLRFPTAGAA
jgi:hypothetical protein